MQDYGPQRWYDWLEEAIVRDRATASAWRAELKQIYDEEIREGEMERGEKTEKAKENENERVYPMLISSCWASERSGWASETS